jgi:dihydroorotate dehydrogenase (fumarate)
MLGPEAYLDQVRRIKEAVRVPVIASLNGTTPGGWLSYAKLIEQAGADALELNVYELVTDMEQTSQHVEAKTVAMVDEVVRSVKIPVAVKLSPYYSALAHLARQLDHAGAAGLVLFNRFYQPDVDPENLEVLRVNLSDPSELLLRLRWLAILSGRVNASLAVTGGVHSGLDAVKAVMTGADAVQMTSALLRHGPEHLTTVLGDMTLWMQEHEYKSIRQMRGCMSLKRCPDTHAYERANYVQVLQSWRGRE